METIIKVVEYIADYINSVPTSSWIALGTLLGGSAIVSGIVAWLNRHRLKKGLERLGRVFVTWMVVFLSALVTVLDFILNNGSTFGVFLPYFATHLTQVVGISTVIYNVAKPSLAWWKARKEGRKYTNIPGLPVPADLGVNIAAVRAPVPADAPSQNLIQL